MHQFHHVIETVRFDSQKYVVAFGIRSATLQHRNVDSSLMWYKQVSHWTSSIVGFVQCNRKLLFIEKHWISTAFVYSLRKMQTVAYFTLKFWWRAWISVLFIPVCVLCTVTWFIICCLFWMGYVVCPCNGWLVLLLQLQIMDFFNVKDFEIPGYSLPQVVVELHTHLWSCAIDYR